MAHDAARRRPAAHLGPVSQAPVASGRRLQGRARLDVHRGSEGPDLTGGPAVRVLPGPRTVPGVRTHRPGAGRVLGRDERPRQAPPSCRSRPATLRLLTDEAPHARPEAPHEPGPRELLELDGAFSFFFGQRLVVAADRPTKEASRQGRASAEKRDHLGRNRARLATRPRRLISGRSERAPLPILLRSGDLPASQRRSARPLTLAARRRSTRAHGTRRRTGHM